LKPFQMGFRNVSAGPLQSKCHPPMSLSVWCRSTGAKSRRKHGDEPGVGWENFSSRDSVRKPKRIASIELAGRQGVCECALRPFASICRSSQTLADCDSCGNFGFRGSLRMLATVCGLRRDDVTRNVTRVGPFPH
jgi:hypothetical protein